jgi:hypothetical protein
MDNVKEFSKMPNNEQEVQECDARDDDSSTGVGKIKLRRLLRLRLASEDEEV